MRPWIALLVLAIGCDTAQKRDAVLNPYEDEATSARLGGEAASEPFAAIGTWVPVQSATKTLLGQSLIRPTLGGDNVFAGSNTFSQTIISSVASGSQAYRQVGGAKLCLSAACTTYIQDDGFGTLNMVAVTNISSAQRIDTLSSLKAGSYLEITRTTLGTCNSTNESRLRTDVLSGGTSTAKTTKLCLCVSDGAASPAYLWRNVITGTNGTTTTCGTE